MTARSLNRRLADLVLVSEQPDRLVQGGTMGPTLDVLPRFAGR